MKVIKIMLVLATLIGCLQVAGYAQPDASFNWNLAVNGLKPGTTVVTKTGGCTLVEFGLNQYGLWNVDWEAYAGICDIGAGTTAELKTDNTDGYMWSFEYLDQADNWQIIQNGITSMSGTQDMKQHFSGHNPYMAKDFRLGYDASFVARGKGNALATGYGYGKMNVNAVVPEPASVLAACSILAPIGFVFRRRKV